MQRTISLDGNLAAVRAKPTKEGPIIEIVITTNNIGRGAELIAHVGHEIGVEITAWQTELPFHRPSANGHNKGQLSLDQAEATDEDEEQEAESEACPTCQDERLVDGHEPTCSSLIQVNGRELACTCGGVRVNCPDCTERCEACDGAGIVLADDGSIHPDSSGCAACAGVGWTEKPIDQEEALSDESTDEALAAPSTLDEAGAESEAGAETAATPAEAGVTILCDDEIGTDAKGRRWKVWGKRGRSYLYYGLSWWDEQRERWSAEQYGPTYASRQEAVEAFEQKWAAEAEGAEAVTR